MRLVSQAIQHGERTRLLSVINETAWARLNIVRSQPVSEGTHLL